jgi:hypothetical protein
MGPIPRTAAANHLILSSARIAADVDGRRIPRGEDLFLLSAALVDSARHRDAQAIELGLESAAALLESLPLSEPWDVCRGYLRSTMEFAWLLLRQASSGEASAARV